MTQIVNIILNLQYPPCQQYKHPTTTQLRQIPSSPPVREKICPSLLFSHPGRSRSRRSSPVRWQAVSYHQAPGSFASDFLLILSKNASIFSFSSGFVRILTSQNIKNPESIAIPNGPGSTYKQASVRRLLNN